MIFIAKDNRDSIIVPSKFTQWLSVLSIIGTCTKDHNYLTVAITVMIAPNYSSTDRNFPVAR